MNKFMKSERLNVSLNSHSVDWEFTYWHRTFFYLIRRNTQANDTDELDALVTFVSPSVYGHITDCDNYE